MKKIIPFIIAVTAALLFIKLYQFTPLAALMDDGYAVTADLSGELTDPEKKERLGKLELQPVHYEDILYQRGGSYYVGEGSRKKKVEMNYPLYVLDGGGLRFLSGQFHTITREFEYLPAYDGLYLVDGFTYNTDKSQADLEEFYFVALSNGLFINALPMEVKTNIGTYRITANSIMNLEETTIRYYYYAQGMLGYGQIDSMSQAEVTIGQDTYDYLELLRLLKLLREKIELNPDLAGTLTEKEIEGQPPEEAAEVISQDVSETERSRERNSEETAAIAEESKEALKEPEEKETGESKAVLEPQPQALSREPGEIGSGDQDSSGDGDGGKSGSDEPGGGGSAGTPGLPPAESQTHPVELDPYVRVKKVNTDGETLPGAKFNLYKRLGEKPDMNTDPLIRQGIKTDAAGELWIYDLEEANYYFREVEAPDGYVLRNSYFNFTVSKEAPQIELTIKNYKQGESQEGGTEDPGGDDGGPVDPNPSDPPENKYEMPVVTADAFEPWVYAANTKLRIIDPDGYISKGIKFTVYKRKIDDNGKEVYSTVLRQTVDKEGEFNLSVLPPDTELFVEGSFRYYTENASRETFVFMKKEENSFRTLPVQNHLLPVASKDAGVSGNTIYPTQVMLSELKVSNTSDYQPGDPSFENFKKDTVSYISKAIIQVSDDGGNTYTDAGRLSGALLSELVSGEAVDFMSDSKVKLKTRTNYQCRLVFYDKFNNEIPTDPSVLSWKTRTCRAIPEGTGTVSGNTTGQVKLDVSILDSDQAIVSGEEGCFFEILYNDNPVNLSGTIDGREFYNQPRLNLSANKKHDIVITNLLFSKKYQYQVKANYDLKDDKGVQRDKLIGSGNLTTAPIASGTVTMDNTMADIRGTDASFSLKLTEPTSGNVLPLLTSFEINTKPNGADGRICKLTMADAVEKTQEDYDSAAGSILIQEMDTLREQPRIEITGRLSDFDGLNAWQAVLDKKASVLVTYPEGSLPQSTRHAISVRSLIEQSGEEYEIPTVVNKNTFSTLKRTPVMEMQDMLLVNDFMELYGFKIADVDGVIINENVTLKLKISGQDTVLDIRKIKSQTAYEMIRFDYLVAGTTYDLEVIADEYNVGSSYATYQTNVLFRTITFEAGSKLKGAVSLSSLKSGTSAEGEDLSNGTLMSGTLDQNGQVKDDVKMTVSDYIEYDPSITYLVQNGTDYQNKMDGRICFYDDEKKYLGKNLVNNYHKKDFVITPELGNACEEAAYIRYSFPNEREDTAAMKRYPFISENLITPEMTDEVYQYGYNDAGNPVGDCSTDFIPVKEGGYYFRKNSSRPRDAYYISYFSKEKMYLSMTSFMYQEEMIRIPKDCHYISITYVRGDQNGLGLYEMGEVVPGKAFQAELGVYLEDGGDYLISKPDYTLRVKQSDSYRNLSYTVNPGDINDDFDGEGNPVKVMEKTHMLTDLKADSAYQIELLVTYRGHELVLHTLTFQTDDIYETIDSEQDLLKVKKNPGGNYLVTKDLVLKNTDWNIALTGVMDFDGHTVTASSGRLFVRIFDTGTVKNLHLVLPSTPEKKNSFTLATYNMGKISNFICEYSGAKSARSAIINENLQQAVIENFALIISSDINIKNTSLFVNGNSGTITEGYYYVTGEGRTEALKQSPSDVYVPETAILARHNSGTISNLYGIGDFYFGDNSGASAVCSYNLGSIDSLYIKGDYYLMKENSGAERSKNIRMFKGSAQKSYYVSEYEYTTGANIKAGALMNLWDTNWQSNVLGEGNFEIQQAVSMGFYPRLKLPACLQPKQPYISLPIIISENNIRILDAKVIESGPDVVDVSLSVENPKACQITGFEVTGVTATVLEQTQRDQISMLKVRLTNPVSYVSSYPATKLYYNNGSSNLLSNVSFQIPAEFYKEISTVEDWSDIRNNPTWNFRLINDIDFSTTSMPGLIIVDTAFRGSLDGEKYRNGKPTGELYRLSGITLNQKNPYVFNNVSGGRIKNLLIEDMILTGKEGTTGAGFCGSVSRSGQSVQLDNVHLRDSVIRGSGAIGGLASNSAGNFTNCSVADTAIGDLSGSVQKLSMGGLVGVLNSSAQIRNCYVKGISMTAVESQTANGVGGLTGYISEGRSSEIYNCYAEGTIDATLNNVGGIVGYQFGDSSKIKYCWSQMAITTKGSVTGGITGKYYRGSINTVVSLGSINSAGTDTYRIAANPTPNGYYSRAYAYEGQLFNGESKDRMDATALITPQEIVDPLYWQDEMCFGGSFDYSRLPESVLPKLYDTDGGILYGQEDVYVQGMGYEVTLTQAYHGGTPRRYQAEFKVIHENVNRDDLHFQVVIDGIGESGVPFTVENGGLTVNYQDSDPDTTYLVANTEAYYKAFDAYNATVQIRREGSESWQKYGLSVTYYQADHPTELYITYWDVSNLTEWNTYMEAHGKTQENYRINGMIDIGGMPYYTGLRLGRLEGTDKQTCGFRNIKQNNMADGELVWIEMAGDVKNLRFTDYMLNFNVPQSNTRNSTGLLASVFRVENVDVSSGKIVANKGADRNVGFFGSVAGNIDGVSMEGTSITAGNTAEDSQLIFRNVGLICGYLEGAINDCTVKGMEGSITVNTPLGTNVGGMIGRQEVIYAELDERSNRNLTIENVTISGTSYLGGIVGYITPGRSNGLDNITADNIAVIMRGRCAGGVVGEMHYGTISNCNVTDISVERAPYTTSGILGGGILGNSASTTTISNCTAVNVTVNISQNAGGICGTAKDVIGCKVSNARITARGTGESELTSGTYAGGIAGTVWSLSNSSVHNTAVDARSNAGGLAGISGGEGVYSGSIYKCYVSPDTVVTGDENVGGLAGCMYRSGIRNSACGATVTASGENAGGLAGLLNMGYAVQNNKRFDEVYFAGKVSAKSFAGGMFGKVTEEPNVSEPNTIIDPDMVNKILIAGDISISSPTGLISTWANGNTAVSDIGSVGYLRVWADTTLTVGTGDQKVVETGSALSKYMPAKFSTAQLEKNMQGALVDTAMLKTSVFYGGTDYQAGQMGFTAAGWSYEGLSSNKMPYVFDSKIPVDNGTGITIPSGTTVLAYAQAVSNPSLCRPYPSGISTVNLELADCIADGEGWTLTVETGAGIGEEIPVDRKTYTMEYNYRTPVKILLNNGAEAYEITVDPTAMRRTVMTDGTGYYYITSSGIKGSEEMGGEYIHLMDGQALAMDGSILDLQARESADTACEFRILEQAKAFDTVRVNGTLLHSFGSYSQLGSGKDAVRRDSRILAEHGMVYSLPQQDPLYADSFLLDRYMEDVYFSYLDESGSLVDIESELVTPEDFARSGIDHICNNMRSESPIVLVRYKSGAVAGFNYLTGESLGDLEGLDYGESGEAVGFLEYVSDYFSGVTGSFAFVFGEPNDSGSTGYEDADTFSNALTQAVNRDEGVRQQLNEAWDVSEQEEGGGGSAAGADKADRADANTGGKTDTQKEGGSKNADGGMSEGIKADRDEKDIVSNGMSGLSREALDGAGEPSAAETSSETADAAEMAGSGADGEAEGGSLQSDGLEEQSARSGAAEGGSVSSGGLEGGVSKGGAPEGETGQSGLAENGWGQSGSSRIGIGIGTGIGDQKPLLEEVLGADAASGCQTDAESAKKDLNAYKGDADTAKQDRIQRVSAESGRRAEAVDGQYMVAFNKAAGGYEVYDTEDFFSPEREFTVSENEKLMELEKKGIKLNLDAGYLQANARDSDQGAVLLIILAISICGLVLVLYQKGRQRGG